MEDNAIPPKPDPVIEAFKRDIDRTLIRVKRAAGRPKDLESIAELEAMLEERNRTR